jgi:hypothetical protein
MLVKVVKINSTDRTNFLKLVKYLLYIAFLFQGEINVSICIRTDSN